MDLHNMDEFLNLQDQSTTNLLSTEQIEQPENIEDEWHSATPMNEIMSSSDNNKVSEWDLLQTGLDGLQGIDLTKIIGQNTFANDNTNCITPDFLIKQQPVEVSADDNKRVTRSRTSGKNTAAAKTEPKKKRNTRTKKLYCICQQPYNGKPMVQCDRCEEWFHCTCVNFDPDTEDEEDIDWICESCRKASEDKKETTQDLGEESKEELKGDLKEDTKEESKEEPKEEFKEESEVEVKEETKEESKKDAGGKNKEETSVEALVEEPKEIVKPTTTTRQTRGSSHSQSLCLYDECNNHTKADSFCSDACARKHNEATQQPARRQSSRVNSMSSKQQSSSPSQKKPARGKSVEEDEPQPAKEEVVEEQETPPMSPSQMTVEENPVRRNVIKNMTNILKSIFEAAVEKAPDMFEDTALSMQERAEQLARSIENTILDELGDLKGRHKTCGESYKSKFRSLLYNLKDKANDVFQMRVVTGDLTPIDLVHMSSEDMANPELKSMAEVLREKSLKNSVLKVENTPIIKKTHKGDIIMMPNQDSESMYSEQVQQELDRIDNPQLPRPEQEVKNEISGLSPTQSASKDPLDDILARISLPAPEETSATKRHSSVSEEDEDPEAKKRKLALDVERLLGDEEDTHFEVEEVDTADIKDIESEEEKDEEMQEAMEEEEGGDKDEEETLPCVWEGRVSMPQVAEFEATARQIGGRTLLPSEWDDVLSPTMWIEGRIPTDRVNNYVTQTQYSQSREIVLLEIEAKGGDLDEQSQILLEYFETKQRYAVVGHNKTRVKDFYLVPLYKSQHIPDCLYVVRVEETKRKNDMFLGVLILSKHAPPPPQQPKKEPAVPKLQYSQASNAQPYQPPSVQPYQPSSTQPYQPPSAQPYQPAYSSSQPYQVYQQPSSSDPPYSQPYQYRQGGTYNYQQQQNQHQRPHQQKQPQQQRYQSNNYQNDRYHRNKNHNNNSGNYNRYYNNSY